MHLIDNILQHYGWQGMSLAIIILLLFVIQLWYYLVRYGRVSRYRNSRRKKKLSTEPPVSVIVPMFAEDYTYLETTLPQLLGQQYAATYEVVVVYVGSDRDFYEELMRMRQWHPTLIVTKIEFNPRFPISVKMALNVGIKAANNEHILITTTDSTPASQQWLAMMGKAFMRGDIVLGYTLLEHKSGLANYLMRASRLQMSMYWLAAAVKGHTYRGSRNNFGFTKSIYFKHKGFNFLNMNIGEEDLFVQQIAKPNNVSVVLIPKGSMIELPWGGLGWWLSQLRHFGSAYRFYPQMARNAVEWDLGSQLLFFLTVLTALIFMPLEFKLAALLLLVVRYVVAALRVRSVAKRVGEKGMVLRYFLFDMFNPLMMLLVRIMLVRKDDTVWR